MKWNWMTAYWLVAWFGFGFGIPETIALVTGHAENTLSDQVWHIEGLGPGRNFANPLDWSPGHYVLAMLTIWLAGHFIWHIWH